MRWSSSESSLDLHWVDGSRHHHQVCGEEEFVEDIGGGNVLGTIAQIATGMDRSGILNRTPLQNGDAMTAAKSFRSVCVVAVVVFWASMTSAQDWPQWRGPDRNGKVTGFNAPATWPKELKQTWKIKVGGGGDSTPALVGDRLYLMARQDNNEVALCLEAATGKEVWRDKYETPTIQGPAGGPHAGPRCSPVVADGKVVMIGATNIVSCYDLAGKLLWRKDELKDANIRFFASASPIVVDGVVICALGNTNNGGIFAYDLTSGAEKWKWTGDGPSYGSPALATVDGTKQVICLTDKKVVSLGAGDGKLMWEMPFVASGRGAYNAATPVVDGQTVYITGSNRGTKALQISKEGDKFVTKELWSNPEVGAQFSTPVLKDGLLYAVSDKGTFFCIDAKAGKTAWTGATGKQNYGAMLDAGSVILALTQKSQLSVIQPTEKAYTELATIKVADKDTFAHPVVAGNRIYVRDTESLALLTIE
jgi:outer membrane protein assembly factor BamB